MSAVEMSIDNVFRRWPTPESRRWVCDFIEAIRHDDNVLAVVGAGSATRADVESEDLDLVVVCRNRKKFRYKAPIEVDLRAFDETTLDSEISRANDLLCWTVKFGMPIYDRGIWRQLRSKWSRSLPFPNPATIRERAARVRRHIVALDEIGDEAAASEMRLSEITLRARAMLAEARVYPASRPELPAQLRAIGAIELANELEEALRWRKSQGSQAHTHASRGAP